jgi:hypothetical protein
VHFFGHIDGDCKSPVLYYWKLTCLDWIVDLGPQTFTGDSKCSPCYEYATITDPNRISLFVLARNVTKFRQEFDAKVIANIKALGKLPAIDAPLTSQASLSPGTAPLQWCRPLIASTAQSPRECVDQINYPSFFFLLFLYVKRLKNLLAMIDFQSPIYL